MTTCRQSTSFLRSSSHLSRILRLALVVLFVTGELISYSTQQQHFQQQQQLQQQRQNVQPQQIRQLGGKVLAHGYSTSHNVQALAAPTSLVAANGGGASCAGGSASASSSCPLTGGYEFNPALLGGQRGLPGIKARINSRGFQYFSTILAPILTQQIKRARIPNINQCIPQVNGCIQVYNLYVSRFRCPQRVVLYPAPPNQIVLAVENLDIGVTGNLGGQINIILPIALFGIVQVNAHQLSIRVALVVDRGVTGAIAFRVASCQVTVGYVDVYIENGGLIGDIANSQFRGRISEMVRSMLPGQLCGQIPSIVNEQLNSKLTAIPQSIPLSQLLQVALNSFGVSSLLGGGGGQCASTCPKHKLSAAPRTSSGVLRPPQNYELLAVHRAQNSSELAQVHRPQQQHPQQQHNKQKQRVNGPTVITLDAGADKRSNVVMVQSVSAKHASSVERREGNSSSSPVKIVQPQRPSANIISQQDVQFAEQLQRANAPKVRVISNENVMKRPALKRQFISHTQRLNRTDPNIDSVDSSVDFEFRSRRKRQSASVVSAARGVPVATGAARGAIAVAPSSSAHQTRVKAAGVAVGGHGFNGPIGRPGSAGPLLPPPPPVPGAAISPSAGGPSASGATKGQLAFATPGSNPCGGCPSSGGSDSPLAILSVILSSLDFNKLSNIYLTVQFLQGYATNYDYTVELNGEFSPGGQGGTPFGAFPMQFPSSVGSKMAEILISDWTINTLFYHLHRVGFISIRVGPETPKIGDLLKTTCSSEEDLEDHGVETDVNDTVRRRRFAPNYGLLSLNTVDRSVALTRRQRRQALLSPPVDTRIRRQDEGGALGGGSLSDLGICLGDILPAVREKYPNQRIVIHIHTARAPSVVLSARNGGTATLDFVLDADMLIQATNEKVGTIQVAATIDFTVKTTGGRISAHAEITNLQLRDPTGSLGLPQDGLDNLGNLGKELLLKAGNEALEKGAPLSLPANLGGLPLTFISPEVTIVEHALHIASDFTIDPSALSQLGLGGGGGC